MRPEKANMIINKAFKSFYTHHDTLYPAFNVFKDKQVKEAVLKLIEVFKQDDIESNKRWGIELEEAPVYYEDSLLCEKSVLNNLFYISDRWRCTGRLKFLQKVIELY